MIRLRVRGTVIELRVGTYERILDIEERIGLAIKIGESHYREFKSAFEGEPGAKKPRGLKPIMSDVGRTLVAFANADGGELLIGVEDDGTITGIPHDESAVAAMMAADGTHVHNHTPLPAPRKRAILLDGLTVAYFAVSKGTQFIHLTSDGRCLRRVDRETIPYSSERILADRLEGQARIWDRETAHGATVEDLDLDLIQGVASQIAYGISVEKCLQYLDLAIISTERPKDPQASRYLENTATTRGKPSITVEAGHAGTVEADDVSALTGGCLNVMRYLKMLAGTATLIENPVWIDKVVPLASEQTGMFYPLVRRGAYVQQGMKVGYVTDYLGKVIFEARAPAAGVILYICAVPSMTKGATIANIGVVER
ncbi:MAG TPA: RNA-binding domain-containing protein [Pyrinomonadaceae bacterium]|nr:RNA-binding domain-containing protein [Pyrinomonadaceae bacterium]